MEYGFFFGIVLIVYVANKQIRDTSHFFSFVAETINTISFLKPLYKLCSQCLLGVIQLS